MEGSISTNSLGKRIGRWIRKYPPVLQPFWYALSFLPSQKRQQRYILLTQGRSGSTLLTSVLNSHPDICCDTWLPKRRFASYSRVIAGRALWSGKKVFVHRLLSYDTVFHQELDQLGPLLDQLESKGWHFIHLGREDSVRQAISYLVAEQRGFHNWRGKEQRKGIAIDENRFRARLDKVGFWNKAEQEGITGKDYLAISYERDLGNGWEEFCYWLVEEHLKLPRHTLSTRLQPNMSSDYQKEISNWAELKKLI